MYDGFFFLNLSSDIDNYMSSGVREDAVVYCLNGIETMDILQP